MLVKHAINPHDSDPKSGLATGPQLLCAIFLQRSARTAPGREQELLLRGEAPGEACNVDQNRERSS